MNLASKQALILPVCGAILVLGLLSVVLMHDTNRDGGSANERSTYATASADDSLPVVGPNSADIQDSILGGAVSNPFISDQTPDQTEQLDRGRNRQLQTPTNGIRSPDSRV